MTTHRPSAPLHRLPGNRLAAAATTAGGALLPSVLFLLLVLLANGCNGGCSISWPGSGRRRGWIPAISLLLLVVMGIGIGEDFSHRAAVEAPERLCRIDGVALGARPLQHRRDGAHFQWGNPRQMFHLPGTYRYLFFLTFLLGEGVVGAMLLCFCCCCFC